MLYFYTRRQVLTVCRLAKVVCVCSFFLLCVHFRDSAYYTEVDHVNEMRVFNELVKQSKIQSIPDIVFSRNVGFHQQVAFSTKRQTVHKINKFRGNFQQEKSDVPKVANDLTLLVVVCSHPAHVHLRQTIRNTWAEHTKNNSNVQVIFLIGRNSDWDEIIRRETSLNQDVLQIDVFESYRNLSNKLIGGMRWVSRNVPNTKFYMKCDDDVYLNIPYLLDILTRGVIDLNEILGTLTTGAKVIRDPRDEWSISFNKYRLPTFPPYVTGGAYVMTLTAMRSLLAASAKAEIIHLEDVYITGILAARANISHVDNQGFSYWMSSKAKPCDIVTRGRIVSVNMLEKDIIALHEGVQELLNTNTTDSCNQ